MKTIIVMLGLILCGTAYADIQCGIQPLPELPRPGCMRMEWVCQCSEYDNCGWQLICIRN